MSRDVRVVILCEDDQHEQFARTFLREYLRWSRRQERRFVEIRNVSRSFLGSADKAVRQRYPDELQLYRIGCKKQSGLRLIVIIDGDKQGAEARLHSLDKSCKSKNVSLKKNSEKIALLAPTWNIETWLAYLKGETVDETRKNYPKSISSEDLQLRVEALTRMCRNNNLRQPAPPSLVAACEEFKRLGY